MGWAGAQVAARESTGELPGEQTWERHGELLGSFPAETRKPTETKKPTSPAPCAGIAIEWYISATVPQARRACTVQWLALVILRGTFGDC